MANAGNALLAPLKVRADDAAADKAAADKTPARLGGKFRGARTFGVSAANFDRNQPIETEGPASGLQDMLKIE
jgi:hypothetical protein